MMKDLGSYNNVIDWYMDEFDKKAYESHNTESYSCSNSDFLELFSIGFCTSFYQSDRIFGELSGGFNEFCDLIHSNCDLVLDSVRKYY